MGGDVHVRNCGTERLQSPHPAPPARQGFRSRSPPFDAWWVTPCRRSGSSGQVNAAGKLWRRLRRIYLGKVSTGLRGVSVNNCCSFIFASYAQVAHSGDDRWLSATLQTVKCNKTRAVVGPWKVKASSNWGPHLSADFWVRDGVEDNELAHSPTSWQGQRLWLE